MSEDTNEQTTATSFTDMIIQKALESGLDMLHLDHLSIVRWEMTLVTGIFLSFLTFNFGIGHCIFKKFSVCLKGVTFILLMVATICLSILLIDFSARNHMELDTHIYMRVCAGAGFAHILGYCVLWNFILFCGSISIRKAIKSCKESRHFFFCMWPISIS